MSLTLREWANEKLTASGSRVKFYLLIKIFTSLIYIMIYRWLLVWDLPVFIIYVLKHKLVLAYSTDFKEINV